jgi:hypothetical protein
MAAQVDRGSMNRLIVVLLSASTMTLTGRVTVEPAPAPAEVTRKVYISATDSKGAPVTDLTAADVTVTEGGKDRPVVSLQPATAPMQVAILVDDAGTGGFQSAVSEFIQKTFGRGQFSISMLSPQALKLVDFTEDVGGLKDALAKLRPRGRLQPDGDQLPEAIADSAKELQQRKAERPVILALTLAGGLLHSVEPNNVLKTIRSSGAALNVVYLSGADLGQVLGDGPKESGGRIEQAATGQSIDAAVVRIADSLLNQYLLTYTLPDGVKMSDRLSVTTSRKGLRLTSPSRIADK